MATPPRGQLRLLTCGSVDDGKSTLIGRLLHECGAIADDTRDTLARDSRRLGTTGDAPDFALLLDGLEAEREQGITIDVAYRHFATARRSFIVADCPGHAQHTRNMATGASNAELAVILVDARRGVLAQTRLHAAICALLGIRDMVLAVNKIDLVMFDQDVFERIAADFRTFAAGLALRSLAAIPVAARSGDNLATRSPHLAWYAGPTLLGYLETVEVAEDAAAPFRLPVQWVNRPNPDFRGLSGTVAGGAVGLGDGVVIAGTAMASTVARILGPDGDVERAAVGEAVTVCLADDLDVARGDMLSAPADRPAFADQFAAHVLWMDAAALLPGRQYALRMGTAWTTASVTAIRHRMDVTTREQQAARALALNEIGFCHLATARPLAFDAYAANRRTGAFILVDRTTNQTVGCGMVAYPLHRAGNVHREAYPVDQAARAAALGQRPMVLWFTGLSGAGKSTIAKLVEQALHGAGRHTYSLDGDNLRHGLNRDLGFTAQDRVENIRRVAEVARLMADAGLIVLCSFISPFRAERQMVRDMLPEGAFVEIFVDTPLAVCAARDAKGLYAGALRGEIPNFTGISSPYEPPEAADLVLDGAGGAPEVLAARVVEVVERYQKK
ncbi:MAG: adenylyl-sulfate kinase [Acetobacteraceae bacterium]|nr:adenylyl-sulfate kinase [Acetobacteraceae bacterium]